MKLASIPNDDDPNQIKEKVILTVPRIDQWGRPFGEEVSVTERFDAKEITFYYDPTIGETLESVIKETYPDYKRFSKVGMQKIAEFKVGDKVSAYDPTEGLLETGVIKEIVYRDSDSQSTMRGYAELESGTMIPLQWIRKASLRRIANDRVKKYLNVDGIIIAIEWLSGETRKYDDGYEKLMANDYGYVVNTVTEGDQEEVDAYLNQDSSNPDLNPVYRIEQLKDDGSFDEYKWMLGFEDEKSAVECYLAHMPFEKFGNSTEYTWKQFKAVCHTSKEDIK